MEELKVGSLLLHTSSFMTAGVKTVLAAPHIAPALPQVPGAAVPGAAIPAGGVGLLSLSPVWQDGSEPLFTTQ